MSAGMLPGIGSGLGGAIGSLFGSGGTSQSTSGITNTSGTSSSDATQSSAQNQSGQQTQTSTPNLPEWYSNFLQSLIPQYQRQFAQATQPVIGQQQQAQQLQGINQRYGDALKQVQSQLARSGALDSGRAAQVYTGLQLGKLGEQNNYLAQVPVQNATFSQQFGNSLLGQGMGFKAPYGETTSGFNNAWQNYFGNQSSTAQNQSSTQQNQTTKNSGSGLFGKIFG